MQSSSKANDVAIITHEERAGNSFEDYLSQFLYNIKAKFETVTLVEDVASFDRTHGSYSDELILIQCPLHNKKIVNGTSKLRSISADLLVVIGHGKPRGGISPSGICFAPEHVTPVYADVHDHLILWTCDTKKDADGVTHTRPSTSVMLADVTAQSNLAIILCCRGDQILQDFLSVERTNFTEMLICDRADIDNVSYCIFFALLLNLLDSDVSARPFSNPANKLRFSYLVKINIRRIFQLINKFGTTPESFWNFIEKIGIVSSLTAVKANQGLPNTAVGADNVFRVSGLMYNFEFHTATENTKITILDDFKALKLVRCDAVRKAVKDNWETSFSRPLDVYKELLSPATHKRTKPDPSASPGPSATTPTLAQMRALLL